MATEELPFRVEIWNEGETMVEQLVAQLSNAIVAIAAFEKASEVYPTRIITLRNRAQVMRRRAR
jgi:hypothetical protein